MTISAYLFIFPLLLLLLLVFVVVNGSLIFPVLHQLPTISRHSIMR